jgi:type I restriction enzyme, S subunit
MDTQQFLADFGYIAYAPDGLTQLRHMIYQLAITGALTPRGSGSESSRDLLEEIESTRQRLVREKSYKRMLELEKEAIGIPLGISLPSRWCWTRLLDLGEINPRNDGNDDDLAAFLPMSGVPQSYRGAIVTDTIKWAEIKRSFTHFANGDVILAKITPCFENGKAAIIKGLGVPSGIGAGTTELHVFRPIHPGVLPEYVYVFLRSPHFALEGEKHMTGTAGQKRLPTDYFATRAFPLPPLEEQRRIVAKVNELFGFCDEFEKQKQKLQQLQDSLRRSMLDSVVAAVSPYELENSWQRLSKHLGKAVQEPEEVDDFVVTLQNMAVRGLLQPWSSSSPPLDQIKSSCNLLRESYTASGILRRQKPVASASIEATYPKHWAIAPFDDVAVVIGGVTKGRKLQGTKLVTCPYLSVANVQRGYFRLNKLKTIQITPDEMEKYLLQEGDLLTTEGGDWDKVGRTAIWRGAVANCIHQNHVFKARVPSEQLLNEWVELVFNSEIGRSYFADASKQTTNLASINMTQLRSFPLPIPPLSEQYAILQKLGILTDICKAWRGQLRRERELSSIVAVSSVASLTGLSFERTRENSMKAPGTRLIAPVRLGDLPAERTLAPLATILAHEDGELNATDLWQRFGGEIDAFYAQLKIEVAHGWIAEPSAAEMRQDTLEQETA